MPLYEYQCPQHGRFEVLEKRLLAEHSCPVCKTICWAVISRPAIIRVRHTEILPYNSVERVESRQRMMQDTATKKALSNYAEQQRYGEGSPYKA